MAEAGKQKDPVYEDWFGLEAVLLVVAARKFRGLGLRGLDSVIPGSSTTARDLAHETIAKLLKKGLWKPGQNGSEIYPLAIVTLNNLFRDVLKSSSYKTTVIVNLMKSTLLSSPSTLRSRKKAFSVMSNTLG